MRSDWPLACPICRAPLGSLRAPPEAGEVGTGRDAIGCASCGAVFPLGAHGVWDFLPPEQATRFAGFLDEYTAVRRAEGRVAEDPAFYRALPSVPPDHPLAWQWRIRARSAALLLGRVLPTVGQAPRVVDVGAGVGWLSRALADRGARPLAVDVSVDGGDGLGAMRHLDGMASASSLGGDGSSLPSAAGGWLPRLRADFDRLPLPDGAAEMVVFNASLHYSPDLETTLREALRVLSPAPGARLVIMDSPLYRRRASGAAMVAERKAAYLARYGFASDALGSTEFLVDDELAALGVRLGLVWRMHVPWYGAAWALRPLRARLRGRREPARFGVIEGSRTPLA